VAGAIAVGADTQKDVVSPLMHNKSVNWATFGKHVAFDVVTTYVGVKAPAVRAPVSGRFLGGVKNARTFSAALRFGSNYARVATLGVLRGFGQLGSFLLGKCRWF
jgi:hypothetical protein